MGISHSPIKRYLFTSGKYGRGGILFQRHKAPFISTILCGVVGSTSLLLTEPRPQLAIFKYDMDGFKTPDLCGLYESTSIYKSLSAKNALFFFDFPSPRNAADKGRAESSVSTPLLLWRPLVGTALPLMHVLYLFSKVISAAPRANLVSCVTLDS